MQPSQARSPESSAPARSSHQPGRRTDTAGRILREALRLFAEQGYERTSIADIQRAVGLRASSGALYKHYPTKEAILQAGLARFLAAGEAGRASLDQLPASADKAFAELARNVLTVLASQADALRIIWRELHAFPELHAQVRESIQMTYAALGAWLGERAAVDEVELADPEATAAVILASLTMYRVFEALFGAELGQIDDARYLRAWHELVVRGTAPPPVAS